MPASATVLQTQSQPHIINHQRYTLQSHDINTTIKKTITNYDDGTTTIDTIATTNHPDYDLNSQKNIFMARTSASNKKGTVSSNYTKEVKRTNKIIAKFTLNGTFEYDDSKKSVKCTKHSDSKWIDKEYRCSNWSVKTESGGASLYWKAWANVKGTFYCYYTSKPMFYNNGTVELKCESDGTVKNL